MDQALIQLSMTLHGHIVGEYIVIAKAKPSIDHCRTAGADNAFVALNRYCKQIKPSHQPLSCLYLAGGKAFTSFHISKTLSGVSV
jgi:hypothetical protein